MNPYDALLIKKRERKRVHQLKHRNDKRKVEAVTVSLAQKRDRKNARRRDNYHLKKNSEGEAALSLLLLSKSINDSPEHIIANIISARSPPTSLLDKLENEEFSNK